MVSQSDHKQRAAFQRFSRHLKLGASLGALVVVLAACGFGGSATANQTTSGNQTGATSAATATATTAPTATSAAAATATHAPAPTATHAAAAPTPTPVPPLQGQIILHAFNAIAAHSNSPIVDMTCPSGYLVAGGGPSSGYSNFTMMQNAPLNTTTWRAEVFNDGASTINVQVQVVCLKVVGLQSQIILHAFNNIAAGVNSPIVDMTCPSGYLVAGGGPTSGYTNFTMMQDTPLNTTTWRAEVNNDGASTINVQEQVVCLKASSLHSQIILHALSSVAAGVNSAIVGMACPSGYLVAGGGPSSGYSNFTMMQDAPINTTTWRAEVNNDGASTINVQEQVVCLKH